MASITPPKYVRRVLVGLQAREYQSFLVGGCVRDMILDIQPQDWDICTSAMPEEVMELFPGSRPTGLKHGTVSVLLDSKTVEVTTFRSEGTYGDHRHPDCVSFVGDLTTDLSRRDFTMNAIALKVDGLFVDPFGGVQDIQNRCIRCVGSPELRFEEDALRMFRALRFSARLGFDIEPDTYAAIEKKAALAENLAAERVRDETEKILISPRPETVLTLINLGLLDKYISKRIEGQEGFDCLALLPKKALYRWAALCRLLVENGSVASAGAFLSSLHLDSRTIRCCVGCGELLERGMPDGKVEWKRQLNRLGVDTVSCAALCRDALYGTESYKELRAVLKSGECFSMKHLAVSGDDLLPLGLKGRELGDMLGFLLDYVIEYPENNKRELLLSLAQGTEE